jgi:tetratricopeptide (TPR) repeat protein
MPQTTFARMVRSDHSMRPPVPEATLAFHSPNACTLCHKDDPTEHHAEKVREWFPESRWQDRILQEGALIEAARRRDWTRLPDMLAYLPRPESDPVVAASLIRMLIDCPDPRKWDPIRACLAHASPLVRARAAEALGGDLQSAENIDALGEALTDDVRLVRVRAVSALAPLPESRLAGDARGAFQYAEAELLSSFRARPDAWHNHYNLGNYRSDRGDLEDALDAYRAAIRLRRDVVQPYVNASVIASRLGRLDEGVGYLRQAYAVDPTDGSVNLNLALALAERGDPAAAERHLRTAARQADTRAQASFNLAVLVARRDPQEAVTLSRTTTETAPDNPRYTHALAFYLDQAGRPAEAADALAAALPRHPDDAELWTFLGECYLKSGQTGPAREHFRAMAANSQLPAAVRTTARRRLESLPE